MSGENDLGKLARKVWEQSSHRRMLQKVREMASAATNDTGDDPIRKPAAQARTPAIVEAKPEGATRDVWTGSNDGDRMVHQETIGAGERKATPEQIADQLRWERSTHGAEPTESGEGPTWLDNYMATPHLNDEPPRWLADDQGDDVPGYRRRK